MLRQEARRSTGLYTGNPSFSNDKINPYRGRHSRLRWSFLALATLALLSVTCARTTTSAHGEEIIISANTQWYQDSTVEEETFSGHLERLPKALPSPGGRGGRILALRTKSELLPIYAVGSVELFEPFVDRGPVKIRGKRVAEDLAPGFELWVGTLSRMDNELR